jgi:acyl-CoA reductase-like NAD-dependent aldehyde dehydrogenase
MQGRIEGAEGGELSRERLSECVLVDGHAAVCPFARSVQTRGSPRWLNPAVSITVVNPATEQPIAELDEAGVDEADAAVAQARAAFPAWRAVSPSDRSRLLRRLATLVEEHGEELAGIESRNVGKPIAGARAEVGMVAEVLHFYAGAVDKHHGESIPVAGGVDVTFREPLGVVGLIVPWNFPLNIASWKIGPALACGNTIVLKPAEVTPLSALRLAELALEAGIPEGVLNVLVGKGSIVGRRLVEHPDVAKIGFTGSTEVGREVMRGAAGTIKRVTLELGGKSANVVFADADLERAAAAAPYAVFDNAGQDCCARSRIFVERSAYDRFLQLLVDATRGVKVGDPADESTEMGPLISAAHRETVASFVDGEPAFRGEIPDGPGYWYPCTLVEASNDDRIAREEVFGPVAAVIPFADEADAVALANDTPYGLSGSIWTRDGARALHVARGIDSGVLSVNSNSSVRPHTPFGGFKQSGFGRELGMQALEGYSEVKNVFISTEV